MVTCPMEEILSLDDHSGALLQVDQATLYIIVTLVYGFGLLNFSSTGLCCMNPAISSGVSLIPG